MSSHTFSVLLIIIGGVFQFITFMLLLWLIYQNGRAIDQLQGRVNDLEEAEESDDAVGDGPMGF